MATLRLLSRSSGLKFNNISDSHARPLPSAGGHEDGATTTQDNTTATSRKRKRSELYESAVDEDLDETDIRRLHKQHKVRITDLHALHDASNSESRKTHKETSRLFPQPLRSFSNLNTLGVHKALVSNLARQAYAEPTEVQLATIPLLLRQAKDEPNLLTVAPTGSGKTLAFLIPLVDKIAKSHRSQTTERHVSSLILAPTKELVGQIVNEGRKLAVGTGVTITEMRKGMRLYHPSREHEDGASGDGSDDESDATAVKTDILVSTPLSLLNAVLDQTDAIPHRLPLIHNLILDEADYLLDPLFRDQVMSIWSACTSPDLRVSLWSATIGSSIEELALSTIASRYSQNPKKRPPLLRTVIGLKDTSLPTISHKLVYASTEPGKLMGLRQLLHPASSTTRSPSVATSALRPPFMIFTQTIPRATALHEELKYDIPAAAGGSTRIAVLHSDLPSTQRSRTMTEFRQGKIWILITTDLLSRGIDFRGINGVVNYDIPTTAASYVHRAGRTGRAGREGGICVTFYTRDDIKYLKPIANLISVSEGKSSDDSTVGKNENGTPSWLLAALPSLSKQDRKDLKQRGVDVRRAIKESDDKEERRKKGKNRIGTSSGYERKAQDRRKGMIEGSKRRRRKEMLQDGDGGQEDGFEGFDD